MDEEVPNTFTEQEGEEIIKRVELTDLPQRDKAVISKVIKGYIHLSNLVKVTGTRITAIRDFFSTKTKKKRSSKPKEPDPDSYTDDVNRALTTLPSKKEKDPEKKNTTNNGRLPASAYTGAKHEDCHHTDLEPGDRCPECGKDTLYLDKDAERDQISLFGGAPVQGIRYHVDVLRCSDCGTTFPARLNPGKYEPSAKSMIAISRYYMGLPFYRLQQFQQMVGVPLPDATQWDLVERLFQDVRPIFNMLIYIAAQCGLIHNDDTSARILSLIGENKTLPKGARYGVHSTGIVAIGEHTIILYFTGRSHSGENMGKLLDLRLDGLEKPIQVSDASPSNNPKGHTDETIPVFCNAHAFRKFKDTEHNFPEFCLTAMVAMSAVFEHDHHCETEQMNAEERMAYHAKHSGPIMEALKTWMESELPDKVEANSDFGKAVRYMLNNWDNLTRFLTVPGAPLDNNIVERALKKLIVHRKNSLFFANAYSAYVGCAIASIIATCEAEDVNALDYLNSLQKKYPELKLDYFQSNIEGELIDKLHEVGFSYDGIILNAAAYTHTSIGIGDAVKAIETPVIEVHISNVYSREEFRHISYIAPNAKGIIVGLGLNGYELALQSFLL